MGVLEKRLSIRIVSDSRDGPFDGRRVPGMRVGSGPVAVALVSFEGVVTCEQTYGAALASVTPVSGMDSVMTASATVGLGGAELRYMSESTPSGMSVDEALESSATSGGAATRCIVISEVRL